MSKKTPKTTEPSGANFVAQETLYARTDDGSFVVVAHPGETCEKVNPASLEWLIAQGRIVPTSNAGE